MKWCFVLGFLLSAVGSSSESNDPPNFDGLNPTQIEKIMIEEILEKPKGDDKAKEKFDFSKTVKPLLDKFKKQLLDEKEEMQKELDANNKAVEDCEKAMKKSLKAALLEVDKKKKKKNKKEKKEECPTKKEVEKCEKKIKELDPKQEACEDLEVIQADDVVSITELIKEWNKQKVLKKDCKKDQGETKFHYVTRLHTHFKAKLADFQKKVDELLKKQLGEKKLNQSCDAIEHYANQLIEVTCKKIKDDNYVCECGKVMKETKICSVFEGCYEASRTAQQSNEEEIIAKNKAAKLEWRAVGRIECLLGVMEKGKADEKKLKACVEGPQISTKPLDLKFYDTWPKKPEAKCEMKGVTKKKREACEKGAKEQKKAKGKAKKA